MARILITGSSTGLGLLAGQSILGAGHEVVLHARTPARAADAVREAPKASAVVIGDLETISGARDAAAQAEALGPYDAVIHNAGIYTSDMGRTADGVAPIFAVNVLAPYILTAAISLPRRLIYLSSGLHGGSRARLDDAARGVASYSQSKLYVLMLAFAVARLRPQVLANGVDPGWVPTRMGGAGAPDDLLEGARTQAALAAPTPGSALEHANRQYFHHMRARAPNPQSHDIALQDRLLEICYETTGVSLP